MSRDDYDDDDDRPRRRRRRRDSDDDYDDVRSPVDGRSGSVTAVGVISIILGSLTLLCGLCSVIGGFMSLGVAGGARGNFGPGPNPFAVFQAAAGVMIVMAILVLVFGVLYLTGGIGVLQRRNWGRIMTLVMAGFSGLSGVFSLIVAIIMLGQPVPEGAKIAWFLVYLLIAAVYITHCIMSFVVLLSGQNAQEFYE